MVASPVLTKTSGERPPILPPVLTTYDGAPDDGDSILIRMTNDVRWTVRHADASDGDGLPTMIDALAQRHRWVTSELEATRMLMTFSLPSVEGFSIDYLLANVDRAEASLIRLLDELDECMARSERRLARHRLQVRLLRDLDPSDL